MKYQIPNNEINYYKFDKNNNIEYNENDYERIISIGDIHGCYDKLINLLNQVKPTNKDLLIFHGDYLDRGPNNFKCMEFVIKMINYRNCIFLLGNHELLLLQHILYNINYDQTIKMSDVYNMPIDEFKQLFDTKIMGFDHFENYFPNGGYKTLYEIDTIEKLKVFQQYIYIIANLYTTFEMTINNQLYIFVHAGINPMKTMDEQLLEDFTWVREEFYNAYAGTAKFIIGHTPTVNINGEYQPIILPNNIMMIDTGSWRGHISAVNIKTNKFWQDTIKPFKKELK